MHKYMIPAPSLSAAVLAYPDLNVSPQFPQSNHRGQQP